MSIVTVDMPPGVYPLDKSIRPRRPARKFKVSLSAELLMDSMKLPKGVVFKHVWHDPSRDIISFSFDDVDNELGVPETTEGFELPEIVPPVWSND